MSYNENVTLIKYEDGYYFTSKCNDEVRRIIDKHKGLVHISIGKPKDKKTDQQMKALRALIGAFFYSGLSSCSEDVTDLDRFTIWIKLQIEYYIDMEVHGQKIRVVKSFGDASKEDMMDCIDKVIKLIDIVGAQGDKKIEEIIGGMAENAKLNG